MPSFILRDLDPTFWTRVQAKAAAEGTTVKAVILRLLAQWLATVVLVSTTVACGSGFAAASPTAPGQATSAWGTETIILSGQSNALPDHLGGPFQSLYPKSAVIAQGSQPISAWDDGQPLWAELVAQLHQPLLGFVWWQGESDAQLKVDHYEDHLRTFLQRVRAANGNPRLFVVVVQVLHYYPPAGSVLGDAEQVRADQVRYVTSDPQSVLVSVDDLPRDPGNHLADAAAYTQAATRILDTLRAQVR